MQYEKPVGGCSYILLMKEDDNIPESLDNDVEEESMFVLWKICESQQDGSLFYINMETDDVVESIPIGGTKLIVVPR